jgi:hypothetical protein
MTGQMKNCMNAAIRFVLLPGDLLGLREKQTTKHIILYTVSIKSTEIWQNIGLLERSLLRL